MNPSASMPGTDFEMRHIFSAAKNLPSVMYSID